MTYPQYPPQQYQPAPQWPTQPPAPAPVWQAPPVQPMPQAPGPYGYPAQQWPSQPPMPQAPVVQGTLADFYNQRANDGGKFIKWTTPQGYPKPPGTQYAGLVAHDMSNRDVRQKSFKGLPATRQDGSPVWELVMPLDVQPCEEFPEGKALWSVNTSARDEIIRAMGEAGLTADSDGNWLPKRGSMVIITLMERKQIPGMAIPKTIVHVQYITPEGTASSPAPALPQQQYAPAPQMAPQQYAPPPAQVPVPQQWPAQAPQQPPAQPTPATAPAPQTAPQNSPPPPNAPTDPKLAEILAALKARTAAAQGPATP